MKKFILTLFILVIFIAASVAYIVVRSLDADAYQQQLVKSLTELTGRQVTVSGRTTLKWMPMPTLVMTGISIANQQGSDQQTMLTADSLQIEIEWASLFKTPLVVKNVELNKPVLYLERLESNRTNWMLPFLSAPDADINDHQLLGDGGMVSNTRIDRLHISAGTLIYDNKITKEQAHLSNITGDISVLSPKGPYKFTGSGHLGSTVLSGTIDLDKIHNDMPSKITCRIQEKNSDLSLEFTGEIAPNDPKVVITGDASFSLKKPAVLLEKSGIPVLADVLKQPAVGSFAIDITPMSNKLDNLIVRFGDGEQAFALTTTLTYQPATPTTASSYVGEAAVNKLDYTLFKPYFELAEWAQLMPADSTHPDIELKVNVPEFVINTQTVKAIEGVISYKNHQLTLQNGKADMPGNMPITFRADTGVQGETPYVLVHAKGKTKEIKPVLTVLGLGALTEPAAGSNTPAPAAFIKEAAADVRLTWAPNFMSVLFNSLKFDATDVTGTVDFATSGEKKLAVDLTINNLNTDTYTGWKETAEKTPIAQVPSLLQKYAADAVFLSDADMSFRTKFKALTWHNLPITAGTISGLVKNGRLDLIEAELSGVATATLKATAGVNHIGTPNANIDSMSFSFNAAQLPLFLGRAGLTSDLPLIMKAAQTQAAGSVAGINGDWKTNILLQLNEASMKFNGTLSRINDDIRFNDFNFSLTHPNFPKFLQLININPDPVRNLTGALRAQGTLNGSGTDLT
ncbi:MAG: AsmA family protein, partial [Alphaproteobacteria bacterium]